MTFSRQINYAFSLERKSIISSAVAKEEGVSLSFTFLSISFLFFSFFPLLFCVYAFIVVFFYRLDFLRSAILRPWTVDTCPTMTFPSRRSTGMTQNRAQNSAHGPHARLVSMRGLYAPLCSNSSSSYTRCTSRLPTLWSFRSAWPHLHFIGVWYSQATPEVWVDCSAAAYLSFWY